MNSWWSRSVFDRYTYAFSATYAWGNESETHIEDIQNDPSLLGIALDMSEPDKSYQALTSICNAFQNGTLRQLSILELPVFFSVSTVLVEDYLRCLARVLSLSPPAILKLKCRIESVLNAGLCLNLVSDILVRALAECEELRHLELVVVQPVGKPLPEFFECILRAAGFSYKSLSVSFLILQSRTREELLLEDEVGKLIARLLRPGTYNPTDRQCLIQRFACSGDRRRLGQKLVEGLGAGQVAENVRVLDLAHIVDATFWSCLTHLPAYVKLSVEDFAYIELAKIVCDTTKRLKGLYVFLQSYTFGRGLAQTFGNAVAGSLLEELHIVIGAFTEPEAKVLEQLAAGLSRCLSLEILEMAGRLRQLKLPGAAFEALGPVFDLPCLRVVVLDGIVPGKDVGDAWGSLVEGLIARSSRLEVLRIPQAPAHESWDDHLQQNWARASCDLTLAVLALGSQVTEVALVDINLLRLLRCMAVF